MNRRVLLTETGVAHVLDDEAESITQFFPYNLLGDVRLDKKKGNLTLSLVNSAEATLIVENDKQQSTILYNRISLLIGAETYQKGIDAIKKYEKAVHDKYHADQAAAGNPIPHTHSPEEQATAPKSIKVKEKKGSK